jgi:hypothetical protein
MDVELKKEVDAMIAAGIKAGLEGVTTQVGQVVEAVKKISELEANQKVLADTIGQQKPISADDVKKLIGEEVTGRETAAQAKAAEAKQKADAAAAAKAKRDAFVAEKLKGVPSRYHADLGDDETKWPEAEKAIRQQLADDLKAAGIKVPDVGGSAGGEAVKTETAKADKSFAALLK